MIGGFEVIEFGEEEQFELLIRQIWVSLREFEFMEGKNKRLKYLVG